jgi:hypothetical protein
MTTNASEVDARARLLKALRRPLLNVVRAASVQRHSITIEDRSLFDTDTADTARAARFDHL